MRDRRARRRPSEPANYSCPCAVGVVFACRRHPATSDIAQNSRLARVCRASDAAASILMAQTEETTRVEAAPDFRRGPRPRRPVGPERGGGQLVPGLGRRAERAGFGARRSEAKRITRRRPLRPAGLRRRCFYLTRTRRAESGTCGRAGRGRMKMCTRSRPGPSRRGPRTSGASRASTASSALRRRPVALRGRVVGLLQAEDRGREFRDAHPSESGSAVRGRRGARIHDSVFVLIFY